MFVKTIIFTLATLCVAVVLSYPYDQELRETTQRPRPLTWPKEPVSTQRTRRSLEDEIESFNDYKPIPTQRTRRSLEDEIESFDDQIPKRQRRSPFGAFGSRNNNPGGGFSQTGGFQQGPFSASVSQGFNRHGMGGPQTFNAGANFANPNTGSGANFGLSKTPSFGGSATAGGSINLHHTPNGNLNAVGQHTQHYDKDWNRVGQSNFAGLQYQNKDTSVGVGATRVEPKWGKGETQYGVNVEKKF